MIQYSANDEPIPTTDDWADLHPSVVSSYELDTTPGSTAISTYRGHKFDIFNPDTWVFDLDDIARSLSNICRFNGHVEFYSVAEHCVRVADILKEWGAPLRIQMLGLKHDAIETYFGDIPRPIKKTADLGGEPVTEVEKSMEYAMFAADGLLGPTFDQDWQHVKDADMHAYSLERDERPNVGQGLMPNAARDLWLQRFNDLTEALAPT